MVKLLMTGDAGIYVNLAAVQTQYAEEIEQGKEMLAGFVEQAAQQTGQAAQVEDAKKAFDALLDLFKQTESLTISVDLDKEAFDLAGLVTVKADSEAAKVLKTAKLTDASALGTLPANELGYAYVSFDPQGMESLTKLAVAAGENQAEREAVQKSLDAMKAAGRQETIASFSMGKPISVFTMTTSEHPEKAVEAARMNLESLKTTTPAAKDVKVEENAFEYKGFKFSKATVTVDVEKLAEQQAQGNPMAGEFLKKFMGDGTVTTYYGTDGKRTVTIMASDEAEAKTKLDAALGGTGGIGSTPGFKAVRSRLPDQVGGVLMFNAQQLVTQFGRLLATLMGGEMKTPDMPKELAYFGGSFAATPAGYRFDLVVPTSVGPVFERGFGAIFQAMQGQIGQ